jgi:DNA-directed RNA polymerase subunit RPC12/RpoP
MVKIVCPKCNVASDYLTEDELDTPLVAVHCNECSHRIKLHSAGVTNRQLVSAEIRFIGATLDSSAPSSIRTTVIKLINNIADDVEKGTWEKKALEAYLHSCK